MHDVAVRVPGLLAHADTRIAGLHTANEKKPERPLQTMASLRHVRKLHSSAAAAGVPALSSAGLAVKSPSLWDKLMGASPVPVLPPMSEPLEGLSVPVYTAPTKAPTTELKKLGNGSIIAAENTPVRQEILARLA